MVQFNHAAKEMTIKIVYYGPGLCGKTTNLQFIHDRLPAKDRTKLVSLNTDTDRTLFFDLLGIKVGVIGGFKTKVQLFTVPGQVFYDATRKLVLNGADGVVFVADSQEKVMDSNVESFENLVINLKKNNYDIDDMPLVLQWNKRDAATALPIADMQALLNSDGRYQTFSAVAVTGEGVFETMKAVVKSAVEGIREKYFVGGRFHEDRQGSGRKGKRPQAEEPAPVAVTVSDEVELDLGGVDDDKARELVEGRKHESTNPEVPVEPEVLPLPVPMPIASIQPADAVPEVDEAFAETFGGRESAAIPEASAPIPVPPPVDDWIFRQDQALNPGAGDAPVAAVLADPEAGEGDTEVMASMVTAQLPPLEDEDHTEALVSNLDLAPEPSASDAPAVEDAPIVPLEDAPAPVAEMPPTAIPPVLIPPPAPAAVIRPAMGKIPMPGLLPKLSPMGGLKPMVPKLPGLSRPPMPGLSLGPKARVIEVKLPEDLVFDGKELIVSVTVLQGEKVLASIQESVSVSGESESASLPFTMRISRN
jgi:signal recognition particle receptor subunit beta